MLVILIILVIIYYVYKIYKKKYKDAIIHGEINYTKKETLNDYIESII